MRQQHKTKHIFPAAMVAALALTSVAHADTESAVRANNNLAISAGITLLGYGETTPDQPGYLDTENGNLGTVQFELNSLRDTVGVSNVYEHFDIGYSSGETRYDGAVINLTTGAMTPASTITDNEILQGRFALGKGFVIANGLILTPHADIGGRIWRRAINKGNPPGYEEVYYHWFYGGGLKLDFSPTSRLTLSMDGAVRRNAGSTMEADFADSNFKLGNKTNTYLRGRASYNLIHNTHLFAEVTHERFKYGRSDTQPSGFYEPDSSTNQISYLSGIAFGF